MSPEPPSQVDWQALDGGRFQDLCLDLLAFEGYELQDQGVGPDGGIDAILIQTLDLPDDTGRHVRWAAQFKFKMDTEATVKPRELGNVENLLGRFQAEGFFLVTNGRVTNKALHELRGVLDQKRPAYYLSVWTRRHLERRLACHRNLASRYFPSLPPAFKASATFEIIIDVPFDDFSRLQERILRHALASFLEIPVTAIVIREVIRGSTKVVIELPEQVAQGLRDKLRSRRPTIDLGAFGFAPTVLSLRELTPRVEAARRIERARRLESDTLDLGDLALTALPTALEDLHHVRRLYLGRVRPTADGREELDSGRTQPSFRDLLPLAGLVGLESLDLSSTGVTDLSPLAGLAGLQSLDLLETGVTDLSPLARLVGLHSLNLHHTSVADLSPLAGLTGLNDLRLAGTGVTDLWPLARMAELEDLTLAETGVTDLSPLAGLAGLQILDLSNTGVTNLSPLAGLAGLQILDLSGTGVADLSPLAGLAVLESLELSGTGVTDLSPLAGLAGLQILDLSGTGVTDLLPLTSLQSLIFLKIARSRSAIPAPMLKVASDLPGLWSLIADHASGVPREVLSRHAGDDCLARLRTYFAELEGGSAAENEETA